MDGYNINEYNNEDAKGLLGFDDTRIILKEITRKYKDEHKNVILS